MNGNPVVATATAEEQPSKPRPPDGEQAPKYFLDIEGAEKPWYESTITTEQIIALGGWDPSLGVLLIDAGVRLFLVGGPERSTGLLRAAWQELLDPLKAG